MEQGKYDFNEDIKSGEEGEIVVQDYLKTMGCTIITDNKDYKYDFIATSPTGKPLTYEVKTDIYCSEKRDTGNMFIEYECRNKPSGIDVTEADWFVTYYKHFNQMWFIETSELKNLIHYNNFRQTAQSGDEGSNTKGYLINRKDYQRFFKVKNLD